MGDTTESNSVARAVGIGLVLLASGLFFVAWSEYQENVAAVESMRPVMGEMVEALGGELEPSVPNSSKYCGVFGVVALVSGVLLIRAPRRR